MENVFWTVRAQRRLRQALAREVGRSWQPLDARPACDPPVHEQIFQERLARLNFLLQQTFKNEDPRKEDPEVAKPTIVVQDQLQGFRPKERMHILLVEVFGVPNSGPHLVKIGPQDKLQKECDGWKSCRPEGLRNDIVFLPLTAGCEEPRECHDAVGGLMSLIYGDAHQFIGVETTSNFETAVLQAVQFGFPTVSSVTFVLVELFERIGHLLYPQSYVDDPADESRQPYLFHIPHLAEAIDMWHQLDSPLFALKSLAGQLDQEPGGYLDPIEYLKGLQTWVQWRDVPGSGQNARLAAKGDPPSDVWNPYVNQVIPRMLRGCAHGDLHGRNILIGIVNDRALWPTVFDYEDMGPNNLIGWDFVKLEVELKIRAFANIFGPQSPVVEENHRRQEENAYVTGIHRFEVSLNEWTEAFHKNGRWPKLGEDVERMAWQMNATDGLPLPDTAADPVRNLRTVLLELRHQAYRHLGQNRGRPNEWLEEYYFLLTCYAVYASRFDNLQSREKLAALIIAGTATMRLTWPRKRLEAEKRLLD